MLDYVKRVLRDIVDFFLGLNAGKKVALTFVAGTILTGLAILFYWAGGETYRPLMTNLNSEDSASIIRVLREKGIPFKVERAGKDVFIPPESVFDLRLELAAMGLPQTSVVGYEIFDKQSLGTTSFVNQVNRKRALEGELTRTIGTIKGVRRARVHLAMPKKSTFIEDQKSPKASVVVDLQPGIRLSEKQVYGIGTLVASAVEGMEVAGVTVVDSMGKVLSKNQADPLMALTATQLDYQRKVEEGFEQRIEQMLSRVVGDGRVVARVSAELDFSRINETQTSYDPDGVAVRSVGKNNSSMQAARPGPYGVPGAQTNVPPGDAVGENQVKTDTKKFNEVTNYEVPQTVKKIEKQVGEIRKLSVAVLVDGQHVKSELEDGAIKKEVVPWGPEKLKEFESVIASAVALDKKRGDILEIKNMTFKDEDFDAAQRLLAETERRTYLRNMLVYVVIGVVIVMFFLYIVRPFIKWITESSAETVENYLPQTIEELEKLQKNSNLPGMEDVNPEIFDRIDPEKVEGEMIKEKIITLVDASPQKAAMVLREWIREGKKRKEEVPAGPNAGKTA